MILQIQVKSEYYEKGRGNMKQLLDVKNMTAKLNL